MILILADTARPFLKKSLEHARSLSDTSIVSQTTALLALINDLQGRKQDADALAREWQTATAGDARKSETDREEVRRVAGVIGEVGRKVAMGWR